MSWKDELQLLDLDEDQRLEFTCKTCSHVHHYEAGELQISPELLQLWLTEIEARETCKARGCAGSMRLAIYHDSSNSGFIGGVA